MRYILIPVKDLTQAKQRLAGLMTQEERTSLAWAMLENTFAVVTQVTSIDRIAVVTLYEPAIALAKSYGMEVVIEAEQVSESASVDFGSLEVTTRGAESVLRLPIDLPLITVEDIETTLVCERRSNSPVPSVVIIPSRDGTGTNAILRRPPTLFPSHFGPDSLAKHLKEAARIKAECQVIDIQRIALDIDEPDDLTELLKQGQGKIGDLLRQMGIEKRLPDAKR